MSGIYEDLELWRGLDLYASPEDVENSFNGYFLQVLAEVASAVGISLPVNWDSLDLEQKDETLGKFMRDFDKPDIRLLQGLVGVIAPSNITLIRKYKGDMYAAGFVTKCLEWILDVVPIQLIAAMIAESSTSEMGATLVRWLAQAISQEDALVDDILGKLAPYIIKELAKRAYPES